MSTQELCDAIYQAVSKAGTPLTRLEICREIGKAKSPRTIQMIEHLCSTEYFRRTLVIDPHQREAFVYEAVKRKKGNACAEVGVSV